MQRERWQKLPQALPQCPLCGSRIIHDLRCRIETHGGPTRKLVLGPIRVSLGRKGNPGSVHGVCEPLRWVGSQHLLCPAAQGVEDEGNLKCVACAKESVELR